MEIIIETFWARYIVSSGGAFLSSKVQLFNDQRVGDIMTDVRIHGVWKCDVYV